MLVLVAFVHRPSILFAADVLLRVLAFLPAPDLARLACTCTAWRKTVTGARVLWQRRFDGDWYPKFAGLDVPSFTARSALRVGPGTEWRAQPQQMYALRMKARRVRLEVGHAWQWRVVAWKVTQNMHCLCNSNYGRRLRAGSLRWKPVKP